MSDRTPEAGAPPVSTIARYSLGQRGCTAWVEKPLFGESIRPGRYSIASAIAAGVAGTMAYVKH